MPEFKIDVERRAGPGVSVRYETSETVVEEFNGNEIAQHVEVYVLIGHNAATKAFAWRVGGEVRGEPSRTIVILEPAIITANQAVLRNPRRALKDAIQRD